MALYVLLLYRAKGTEPNMKRHKLLLYPAVTQLPEQLIGKMQTGGRRGSGTGIFVVR